MSNTFQIFEQVPWGEENVHFEKKLELKCTKINATEKIDSAELKEEDDNENCQKQNTHKKIENPQNLLLGQKIHQNMSNDENFNESELDSQNNELSNTEQNKTVHKSGKRKYPCTICGKTFNVNSNLIKHQSKKHKHSCDFCNRKFSKISKFSGRFKAGVEAEQSTDNVPGDPIKSIPVL